ncbi:NAD(P)H-binding protein [Leifsonia sp. NPDC058230]|uniref:NAD(P)H-binding protein n=1 Tax=Leifsonia sp. NPDC058230 TaxID=3346391 RepID=UPI0036DBE599
MGRYAVFGATGGTGRDVVAVLLAGGDQVVAIGRSTKRLQALAKRSVETVALDLTRATVEELTTILTGCDGVVFLAGSTDPGKVMAVDRDGSFRAIAAAQLAGAERFVQISSIGAGDRIPAEIDTPMFAPFYEAKRAADERLRASGLKWTIIEPGYLVDRPPTACIELGERGIPLGEIPRADVAATLVAVLHDNRTIGRQWQLVGGDTPIRAAIDALV